MNPPPATARIFVGTDRSQLLAVQVLEHSIRRHASIPVEVTPLLDVPVPTPRDPRNWQRTGFSFSRFCIPQLAGYQGRALYLDADMLVFADIAELWNTPFAGAKVAIQEAVRQTAEKLGARDRKKQTAVMFLDCGRLDWDVGTIVAGLDEGRYDYDQLMSELCILGEDEIHHSIPAHWNSLEHFDDSTCLLHYTDMLTQPWVSPLNPLAGLWCDEVRRMLADGTLTWAEIEREIELGYFRPSLLDDLRWGRRRPAWLRKPVAYAQRWTDRRRKYQPHREVYQRKRARQAAMRAPCTQEVGT